MGYGTQTEKGYALRTALAGHGGSSTRAEIAAGILACQAKRAVNIGSDSQAFVTKANEVAEMVKRGKGPRRPWSTHTDGDMWELLHETLKKKGPNTFKATKIKGHATNAMVESGKVQPQDKEGNDEADYYAAEGVKLYGKETIEVGARLTARHFTNMPSCCGSCTPAS